MTGSGASTTHLHGTWPSHGGRYPRCILIPLPWEGGASAHLLAPFLVFAGWGGNLNRFWAVFGESQPVFLTNVKPDFGAISTRFCSNKRITQKSASKGPWNTGACLSHLLSAQGYPGNPHKGDQVSTTYFWQFFAEGCRPPG